MMRRRAARVVFVRIPTTTVTTQKVNFEGLFPKKAFLPLPFRVGVSISYCVAVVEELLLGAVRAGGSKRES